MTDIPPLASMTIKDLRQLAGEHNVQNRSRLGKEELITALQQILAAHAGHAELRASAAAAGSEQPSAAITGEAADVTTAAPVATVSGEAPAASADASPTPAPAEHAPAPSASPASDAAPHAGEDDAEEALRPSLAADGAAEPEEITAESMALLAQPAAPSAAAHAGGTAGAPGAEHGGHDGFHGDGQPSDPNRRRRRRRRRRGRGRDDMGFQDQRHGAPSHGGEGESDEGDEGLDGDSEGDEGGAENAAVGAPAASAPTAHAPAPSAEGQARAPFAPAPGRPAPHGAGSQPQLQGGSAHPQRSHQEPAHGAGPSQHPGQSPRPAQPMRAELRTDPRRDQPRHDQRPPRPRLDGQLRSLPSVLDRLCTFSKGVLELCGADTPTWAQPRLSELLAEIGMVMVPVAGVPHPEFHEVIGTSASKQVSPGHIAEMVAPGFALRGDRGDLFPLRKAKVKVAEGGAPPTPPRPTRPFEDAPQAPGQPVTPSADAIPAGEVADQSVDDRISAPSAPDGAPSVDPEIRDRQPSAPRHERHDAPRGDRHDGPRAERHDAPRGERRDAPRGDRHDAPRGERHDAPRGDRQEQRRPPLRQPERPAPAERGPQPEHDGGERPAPQPAAGRPPLRTHPRESAEQAPALPLATQVPEELAARAKAEGFRSLGLNDQILADLAAIGYQEPTPIQAEAIPVVIAGKDLLGQAQTGTGKTAAFALPILQGLYSFTGQGPVALVLCPTRELARQVHSEFTRMAGASGARAAIIYGGVPMEDQIRALDRAPHVVIGTPGRIIDHMRRKTLDLSRLKIAVLDEADQMLDIGFWPDVQFIISHTPPARQTLLFSATFPEPIRLLAEKHMKEPAHVRISPAQVTVEQVDQKYIAVPRERKNELLAHFIETQNPEQLVVFCKTKHQTDRVAEVLKRKNMSAAAIHGDLPQSKRERTLQAFRSRELQCLIATNVAARGLDIPTVSHVVNYDIPEAPEEYVHRIGRTARNGAKGIARTFITPEDGQFLVEIEKHIGLLLEEEKVDGFTEQLAPTEVKRSIAEMPVGQPRLLKPLVGGIRLGRRR